MVGVAKCFCPNLLLLRDLCEVEFWEVCFLSKVRPVV
jgi:hypothetical protein